jgi:hypothetical protein
MLKGSNGGKEIIAEIAPLSPAERPLLHRKVLEIQPYLWGLIKN